MFVVIVLANSHLLSIAINESESVSSIAKIKGQSYGHSDFEGFYLVKEAS